MPISVDLSTLSEDELYVRLTQKTKFDPQNWRMLLTLEPPKRISLIQDWITLGDMSWTRMQSTMEEVEAILVAIANIAAPVTVIVGGVTGIGALITTLKGI